MENNKRYNIICNSYSYTLSNDLIMADEFERYEFWNIVDKSNYISYTCASRCDYEILLHKDIKMNTKYVTLRRRIIAPPYEKQFIELSGLVYYGYKYQCVKCFGKNWFLTEEVIKEQIEYHERLRIINYYD